MPPDNYVKWSFCHLTLFLFGVMLGGVYEGRHTGRVIGERFSEAARLLWIALEARGGSQAELARACGVRPAVMHRWLYGDRRPGRASAMVLCDVLGIPLEAWDKPPIEAFALPA